MINRLPATAHGREQRKQDLLLASSVVRSHVVGAAAELGQRADAVGLRVLQVRAWVARPPMGVVAGAGASLLVLVLLGRLRVFQVAHWGLLGWRFWRVMSTVVARFYPQGAAPRR